MATRARSKFRRQPSVSAAVGRATGRRAAGRGAFSRPHGTPHRRSPSRPVRVTVGSIAWSLVADTSKFTGGVLASKQELRALKDVFQSTRTPVERFSDRMAELQHLQQKFPASSAAIQRAMDQLRNSAQPASVTMNSLSRSFGGFATVSGPAAAALIAFVAVVGAAKVAMDGLLFVAGKVHEGMEELDASAKKARVIGIDPAQLEGLQHAASDLSGVTAEAFNTAFSQFARRIADAASGETGGAADALERLGLSAQKLSAMSPLQSILAVADAMEKVQNPAERLQLSYDLLGKQGGDLATMLAAGDEEIKKLIDDFMLLSGAEFINHEGAEQALDQIGRLNLVLESTKKQLASDLSPLVQDVAGEFVNMFQLATANGVLLRDTIRIIAFTVAAMTDEIEKAGMVFAGFHQLVNSPSLKNLEGFSRLMALTVVGGEGRHTRRLSESMGNLPAPAGGSLGEIAQREDQKDQARTAEKAESFRVMEIEAELDLAATSERIEKKRLEDLVEASRKVQEQMDAVNLEIRDKGEKLTDSLKLPAEKLRDDLTNLTEQRRLGSITDETFQRGLEDLQAKARDMAGLGDTGPRSVAALRAGTVEALRASTGGANQEKQLHEQKRTAENTETANDLQKEIRDLLKANPIREAF